MSSDPSTNDHAPTATWRPTKSTRAQRSLLGAGIGATVFVVALLPTIVLVEVLVFTMADLDMAIGYFPGVLSVFAVATYGIPALLVFAWLGAALAAIPGNPQRARRWPWACAALGAALTLWVPIVVSPSLIPVVLVAAGMLWAGGRFFASKTAVTAIEGTDPAVTPETSAAATSDSVRSILLQGALHGAAAMVAARALMILTYLALRVLQGRVVTPSSLVRIAREMYSPWLCAAAAAGAIVAWALTQKDRVHLTSAAFAGAAALAMFVLLLGAPLRIYNLVLSVAAVGGAWFVGRRLQRQLSTIPAVHPMSNLPSWSDPAFALAISLLVAVPTIISPAYSYVQDQRADRARDQARQQINDQAQDILTSASLDGGERIRHVSRRYNQFCDKGSANYASTGRFFDATTDVDAKLAQLQEALVADGFSVESALFDSGTRQHRVELAAVQGESFVAASFFYDPEVAQLQLHLMRGPCVTEQGDVLVARALTG